MSVQTAPAALPSGAMPAAPGAPGETPGAPAARPTKSSLTDDQWNALPANVRESISGDLGRVESNWRKAMTRNLSKQETEMAELRGKVDGIASNGGGTPANPQTLADYGDGDFSRMESSLFSTIQAGMAAEASDEARDLGVRASASMSAVAAERRRRDGEAIKSETLQLFRDEQRAERLATGVQSSIEELPGGRSALNDPDNPLHQSADGHYRKLLAAQGGKDSPALALAAFQVAQLESELTALRGRTAPGGGGPVNTPQTNEQRAALFHEEQATLHGQGDPRGAFQSQMRQFLATAIPGVPPR